MLHRNMLRAGYQLLPCRNAFLVSVCCCWTSEVCTTRLVWSVEGHAASKITLFCTFGSNIVIKYRNCPPEY